MMHLSYIMKVPDQISAGELAVQAEI